MTRGIKRLYVEEEQRSTGDGGRRVSGHWMAEPEVYEISGGGGVEIFEGRRRLREYRAEELMKDIPIERRVLGGRKQDKRWHSSSALNLTDEFF